MSVTRLFLVVCAAIVCVGCGQKGPTLENVTPAPPVAVALPLTDDEVKDFASAMEKAAQRRDREQFRRGLRVNELFERCVSDMGMEPADRENLLAIVRTGSHRVGDDMLALMNSTDGFKLLRIRTSGGKPSAVYRLLTPEGTVNYHEITFTRHADGIGLEDMYNFAGGELLSISLRRMILQFALHKLPNSVSKLPEKDRRYLDNAAKLREAVDHMKSGNHTEGLAAFRRLPADMSHDKVIQLKRIEAAAQVSEKEHLAEIEAFRRDHPADPACAILELDYRMRRKELDLSLKAIKVIDDSVGGDPYLFCLRAKAYLDNGRFADAATAAASALAAEPTLQEAYFTAVAVNVAAKDHAATLNSLKAVAEKTSASYPIEQLKAAPEFAPFVASPQFAEYERWLASRMK